MKYIVLTVFFASCFISCTSTKINPLVYMDDKITFGSGGGIAGLEKSYTLLDNGWVFQLSKRETQYEKLVKLKRNETIQIFKNYKLLNFENLELNSPGNTYKFIQFFVDGKEHRVAWSSGENVGKASTMHAILMNSIKK